jgi:uncharacterized membrane protein
MAMTLSPGIYSVNLEWNPSPRSAPPFRPADQTLRPWRSGEADQSGDADVIDRRCRADARPGRSRPAPTPDFAIEKCYGIAAVNASDYSTARHSCAGQSSRASDPAAWLYVPAGTCTKIDGGSRTAKS